MSHRLLLVLIYSVLMSSLAIATSNSCLESLYGDPQWHLKPVRLHEKGYEAKMQQQLKELVAGFKNSPQKTVDAFARMAEYPHFSSFSWVYFRALQAILRDIVFAEKLHRSKVYEFRSTFNQLVELQEFLLQRHQRHTFVPNKVQSADDVVFQNFMVSLNTMLGSTPGLFKNLQRNIDREKMASAEIEAALRVLSKIKVNRIFAQYLLVSETQLANHLFGSETKQKMTISVIKNICQDEADFVSLAISKIIALPWGHRADIFTNLVVTLHGLIGPNKHAKFSTDSLQEIENILSYRINAPVRDSELYLINLLDSILKTEGAFSSDSRKKMLAIVRALFERTLPLSDKNKTFLLERLVHHAQMGHIPEASEIEILEKINEYDSELPSHYHQLKAVSKPENDEEDDGVTFF